MVANQLDLATDLLRHNVMSGPHRDSAGSHLVVRSWAYRVAWFNNLKGVGRLGAEGCFVILWSTRLVSPRHWRLVCNLIFSLFIFESLFMHNDTGIS